MDEIMGLLVYILISFVISFCAFVCIFFIGRYIFNFLKDTSFFKKSRFFNIHEYFPNEQIFELRQLGYLVMILMFFVSMLYLLFSWGPDTINIAFLDILLSLYLMFNTKRDSPKNKVILFLLMPLGSISFLFFGINSVSAFDLIHAPIYLYFIKIYFSKFMEYTETNSLGITIILLFSIIFVSFIITMIVENVSPLNSMVMVSNAFTSNGYAILGSSGFGKLNSLVLVWAGFFLSGIGTATLTVTIVMKHINSEFDRLEDLAKKNKKN